MSNVPCRNSGSMCRSAVRWLLAATFLCGAAQAWSQAGRPAGTASAASAAASTPAGTVSVSTAITATVSTPLTGTGRSFTYQPNFLPREIEFTPQQVDEIRAMVAKQMAAYHASLVQQNLVAAKKHELWLSDATNSNANDTWNRQHMQDVLARHAFFSMLIFWIVIGILAISLGLTIYQLTRNSSHSDLVLKRLLTAVKASEAAKITMAAAPAEASGALTPPPAPARGDVETLVEAYKLLQPQQTLALGPTGLQLGTQLVGLVLLAFSLAFFYLYLDRVYPVTVAKPNLPAASDSADPNKR